MTPYERERDRQQQAMKRDRERAIDYLARSIDVTAGKLRDDRDWKRCKRFFDRVIDKIKGDAYSDRVLLCLLPYSEYLQTEHWKQARTRAMDRAQHRCQTCNGDGELHTHHRTYERVGGEREEDLIVLCKRCHELFHTHCQLDELAD